MTNSTYFHNDWEQVFETPASSFRQCTYREMRLSAESWDLGDAQYIVRAEYPDGTFAEFAFGNQATYEIKVSELDELGCDLTILTPDVMTHSYDGCD